MGHVSVRDLRNQGGEIIDRAARGETITITKSGRPVAEMHSLTPPGLGSEALLARWRRLPPVDPVRFREDIDSAIDPEL